MAKQARRTTARATTGGRKTAKKAAPKKGAAKKGAARKAATSRSASSFQMPDWVNNAMGSPLMREAVAAALIAGAGAAAAVLAKRHGPSGKQVKSALSEASQAARNFADNAVGAFAGAASDTVRDLLPEDTEEENTAARRDWSRGHDR
jgi:hypothetical protein